ncbi:uncharacterized protein LOC132742424 [Ruditapes philippinarum]|uniref:uncharacterized protein LOC132742424 n=1 Tax=Ruditapes philippinarum TaxID=129788 RepID=UPI00295A642A|nr:uncharacterized protein LOC132742424 [Ruditapes philippinarum]
MARQISTSVSDLILACSALYVTLSLFQDGYVFAASGLLIQGTAAGVGVVRFAMRRPESSPVFRAHKLLSWLAATAGMGLIAYQFCTSYQVLLMSYIIISFSGLVTLTSQFMDAKNKQLFVQASSGLALLTVLILSLLEWNVYGISAALTYIISGAVFGSDGVIFGVQRVDLLHYGLVAGNIFFLFSLS